MFHVPAHKSRTAGSVSPGLAEHRAMCEAQNAPAMVAAVQHAERATRRKAWKARRQSSVRLDPEVVALAMIVGVSYETALADVMAGFADYR